jgi:hypothetical protein
VLHNIGFGVHGIHVAVKMIERIISRVREILISVDFVALYFIAYDRKLRKVPREFFKL